MSDSPLRDDARQWRDELSTFVDEIKRPLPNKNQLSPLQNWHRRVTGGVLQQFLNFLQKPDLHHHFPLLEENPLAERVFLYITDEAGLHATEELIDPDSEQVFCLLKEQWRAYLEDSDTDHDEEFQKHYEFWSVWHTNLPTTWDVAPIDAGQAYWIHEEGFALADKAGRGAQHLWKWDGKALELVDEMITSWVS